MYERFYGLREKPFNMTPDPRFLHLSPDHREAFAHLQYGVQERRGFVAITGEVGTGKTTLVHALLSNLKASTKTAFIFSTSLTAKGLLKMMVADFGIRSKARTKTDLLLELHVFLLEQFRSGGNAVLIVDEAQGLSFRLLEEIRMLSNLETDREKLLQIILVGQPELDAKLALPQLRQLRQRISSRYHIHPLDRQETGHYIQHRLRVAGLSSGDIFDAAAEDEIYRASGGIPRLINMICDCAMLLGYTYGKTSIGMKIVDEAVEDLQTSGAVSPQTKETEAVATSCREGSAGGASWWQRVFRPLSAATSLLLGAALLSTPTWLKGHRESPSVDSWDSQAAAAWVSAVAEERDDEVPLTVEKAEEPSPELAERTAEANTHSAYSVHVGSFRQLSRAEKLRELAQEKGLEPIFILPVELPGSGRWLRVMVGRYGDRDAAAEAAARLLASGLFSYAQSKLLVPTGFQQPEELVAGDMPTPQHSASQGAGDE